MQERKRNEHVMEAEEKPTSRYKRISESILVAALTFLAGLAAVDHDRTIRLEGRLNGIADKCDERSAQIYERLGTLEEFRTKGARFTADDGRRLERDIAGLEARIRLIEAGKTP